MVTADRDCTALRWESQEDALFVAKHPLVASDWNIGFYYIHVLGQTTQCQKH